MREKAAYIWIYQTTFGLDAALDNYDRWRCQIEHILTHSQAKFQLHETAKYLFFRSNEHCRLCSHTSPSVCQMTREEQQKQTERATDSLYAWNKATINNTECNEERETKKKRFIHTYIKHTTYTRTYPNDTFEMIYIVFFLVSVIRLSLYIPFFSFGCVQTVYFNFVLFWAWTAQ